MNTIQTHYERIKSGRFSKNEINALTKIIASTRFAKKERQEEIMTLVLSTTRIGGTWTEERHGRIFISYINLFDKPCKITSTQTAEGKAWLKTHYIKKNGEERQAAENISARVLGIIRKLKRFEFIGVLLIGDQYSKVNTVKPLYRAYDSKGNYFDYSPIHWAEPIIIEGV